MAGHGTFIAGLIEQLTPGCEIRVQQVFEPEGDVGTFELSFWLWYLMEFVGPDIVNFSFGGTGRDVLFGGLIGAYHERTDVVFVAAAGNEGSCVEQYPAALPSVVGVAGLGPSGPAEWSNYGPWVDVCSPGGRSGDPGSTSRPPPRHGHDRQSLTAPGSDQAEKCAESFAR